MAPAVVYRVTLAQVVLQQDSHSLTLNKFPDFPDFSRKQIFFGINLTEIYTQLSHNQYIFIILTLAQIIEFIAETNDIVSS